MEKLNLKRAISPAASTPEKWRRQWGQRRGEWSNRVAHHHANAVYPGRCRVSQGKNGHLVHSIQPEPVTSAPHMGTTYLTSGLGNPFVETG